MEKNVKILLIACIVLIAMLSLTVGMLIGNQDTTRLALNATNNSNLSVNTTNNTTTKTKVNNTAKTQKSKYISRSQAMAIANKYVSKYGQEAAGLIYMDLITTHLDCYGNPYYHVELKWKPGHYQPYDAGYVVIDAKNGAVNPDY